MSIAIQGCDAESDIPLDLLETEPFTPAGPEMPRDCPWLSCIFVVSYGLQRGQAPYWLCALHWGSATVCGSHVAGADYFEFLQLRVELQVADVSELEKRQMTILCCTTNVQLTCWLAYKEIWHMGLC